MKKIYILSGIAVLLTLAAGAQTDETAQLRHEKKEDRKEMRKLRGTEVDLQAKEQFRADFGNVSSEVWTREPQLDVVEFVKDGVAKSAYYDYDNKLVGTTEKKTFADLPEKARMQITKKYVGYTIGEVLLFDDNEWNESDMILYGHEFADADNYFVELIKGEKKGHSESRPGGRRKLFHTGQVVKRIFGFSYRSVSFYVDPGPYVDTALFLFYSNLLSITAHESLLQIFSVTGFCRHRAADRFSAVQFEQEH